MSIDLNKSLQSDLSLLSEHLDKGKDSPPCITLINETLSRIATHSGNLDSSNPLTPSMLVQVHNLYQKTQQFLSSADGNPSEALPHILLQNLQGILYSNSNLNLILDELNKAHFPNLFSINEAVHKAFLHHPDDPIILTKALNLLEKNSIDPAFSLDITGISAVLMDSLKEVLTSPLLTKKPLEEIEGLFSALDFITGGKKSKPYATEFLDKLFTESKLSISELKQAYELAAKYDIFIDPMKEASVVIHIISEKNSLDDFAEKLKLIKNLPSSLDKEVILQILLSEKSKDFTIPSHFACFLCALLLQVSNPSLEYKTGSLIRELISSKKHPIPIGNLLTFFSGISNSDKEKLLDALVPDMSFFILQLPNPAHWLAVCTKVLSFNQSELPVLAEECELLVTTIYDILFHDSFLNTDILITREMVENKLNAKLIQLLIDPEIMETLTLRKLQKRELPGSLQKAFNLSYVLLNPPPASHYFFSPPTFHLHQTALSIQRTLSYQGLLNSNNPYTLYLQVKENKGALADKIICPHRDLSLFDYAILAIFPNEDPSDIESSLYNLKEMSSFLPQGQLFKTLNLLPDAMKGVLARQMLWIYPLTDPFYDLALTLKETIKDPLTLESFADFFLTSFKDMILSLKDPFKEKNLHSQLEKTLAYTSEESLGEALLALESPLKNNLVPWLLSSNTLIPLAWSLAKKMQNPELETSALSFITSYTLNQIFHAKDPEQIQQTLDSLPYLEKTALQGFLMHLRNNTHPLSPLLSSLFSLKDLVKDSIIERSILELEPEPLLTLPLSPNLESPVLNENFLLNVAQKSLIERLAELLTKPESLEEPIKSQMLAIIAPLPPSLREAVVKEILWEYPLSSLAYSLGVTLKNELPSFTSLTDSFLSSLALAAISSERLSHQESLYTKIEKSLSLTSVDKVIQIFLPLPEIIKAKTAKGLFLRFPLSSETCTLASKLKETLTNQIHQKSVQNAYINCVLRELLHSKDPSSTNPLLNQIPSLEKSMILYRLEHNPLNLEKVRLSSRMQRFKEIWQELSSPENKKTFAQVILSEYEKLKEKHRDLVDIEFKDLFINCKNAVTLWMPGVAIIASYLEEKKGVQGLYVCATKKSLSKKILEIASSSKEEKCALVIGAAANQSENPIHKLSIGLEKKAGVFRITVLDALGFSSFNKAVLIGLLPTLKQLNCSFEIFCSGIVREKSGYGCEVFAIQDAVSFLQNPDFHKNTSYTISLFKKLEVKILDKLSQVHMIGSQFLKELEKDKKEGVSFDQSLEGKDKTLQEYLDKNVLKNEVTEQNHYVTKKTFQYASFILSCLENLETHEIRKIINKTLLS